jgi:hypothetical protein
MKQEYRDKTTDLTLIKKNDCIVFKEFTGVKSPIDACNSSNKILFFLDTAKQTYFNSLRKGLNDKT